MNFPKYFAFLVMLVLCLVSIQVTKASLWSDIKNKADSVGSDVKSDVASGVSDVKNKADQLGDDAKSDAISAGKDALQGAKDALTVASAGHIIYTVGKAAVDTLV